MIISRTPLRISFSGGMSDLPSYYEKQEGAVISTSINKYIYIIVNKKFDNKIRASYSITEFAKTPDDLEHELIKESLKLTNINKGIEIVSISDIPSSGTGLGSSSTYTVGLLNVLYAYLGKSSSAEKLASQACNIELKKCLKKIGKQDQYIAAYGGLNYTQFNPDGTTFVTPIICLPETKRKLEENLLFFYTGISRDISAENILKETSNNIISDEFKRDTITQLVNIAKKMKLTLEENKLNQFGHLLHKAWLYKKQMQPNISNPKIDHWYNLAIENGALGGKLNGAGSGGFLTFYAPKENHKKIINALSDIKQIPFKLEPQGSKIIYMNE